MNAPQAATDPRLSGCAAQAVEVDVTMMYVAHDAFNRDLARLLAAARIADGVKGRALKALPAPARLPCRGMERTYRAAGRLAG